MLFSFSAFLFFFLSFSFSFSSLLFSFVLLLLRLLLTYVVLSYSPFFFSPLHLPHHALFFSVLLLLLFTVVASLVLLWIVPSRPNLRLLLLFWKHISVCLRICLHILLLLSHPSSTSEGAAVCVFRVHFEGVSCTFFSLLSIYFLVACVWLEIHLFNFLKAWWTTPSVVFYLSFCSLLVLLPTLSSSAIILSNPLPVCHPVSLAHVSKRQALLASARQGAFLLCLPTQGRGSPYVERS